MNETANARQSPSRTFALVIALLIASFFALHTLIAAGLPDLPSNAVLYFFEQVLDWAILPGIIVGVLSNITLHIASRWIMVGANFAIYFGIVYAVARYWQKRKAKRLSQPAKST